MDVQEEIPTFSILTLLAQSPQAQTRSFCDTRRDGHHEGSPFHSVGNGNHLSGSQSRFSRRDFDDSVKIQLTRDGEGGEGLDTRGSLTFRVLPEFVAQTDSRDNIK